MFPTATGPTAKTPPSHIQQCVRTESTAADDHKRESNTRITCHNKKSRKHVVDRWSEFCHQVRRMENPVPPREKETCGEKTKKLDNNGCTSGDVRVEGPHSFGVKQITKQTKHRYQITDQTRQEKKRKLFLRHPRPRDYYPMNEKSEKKGGILPYIARHQASHLSDLLRENERRLIANRLGWV